jgi:hypothetical protein
MSFSSGLARGAAAAAVIVLSACTGNGSTGCVATPGVFNGPNIPIATLVSPVSGATGVSTGPLDVTISGATSAISLYLKDANGNATFATNFRQASPPSDDVRVGTFAQLASLTTYSVYVGGASPSYNPCGPNPALSQVPFAIGSFTTR